MLPLLLVKTLVVDGLPKIASNGVAAAQQPVSVGGSLACGGAIVTGDEPATLNT